MDSEFERRWRNGLPPFDGVTISSPVLLPLSLLRAVLAAVVALLQDAGPQARLFTLRDWHENDGYITSAEEASWEDLRLPLIRDESLFHIGAGEAAVRTAFFPEERDFYLRFYVADEPDLTKCYGDFDVTCQEPLASQLAEAAEQAGHIAVGYPRRSISSAGTKATWTTDSNTAAQPALAADARAALLSSGFAGVCHDHNADFGQLPGIGPSPKPTLRIGRWHNQSPPPIGRLSAFRRNMKWPA